MKYKKIKADFKYAPGRLYRVLYVREDISLLQLGCVLVSSFGGKFEHYFMFRQKNYQYVPGCFLEDFYTYGIDKPLTDYKMADLGDSFEFDYDTGDGWDFRVKVYKRVKELDGNDEDNPMGIFVDGKGQGIWEDNIATLYDYFAGTVSPEAVEDEENGIYFPWNFKIKKIGDFDKPLNPEKIQNQLDFDEGYADELLEPDAGYVPTKACRSGMKRAAKEAIRRVENEKKFDIRLQASVFQAVREQTKTLDYVKNAFELLVAKHDEEYAVKSIGGILITEIFNAENEKRAFDEESYKSAIQKLMNKELN